MRNVDRAAGNRVELTLGFTGTRAGMTNVQYLRVEALIRTLRPTKARHGDCQGADAQFHYLVRNHDRNIWIIAHPPIVDTYRAFCDANEILTPRPYVMRNHDVVDGSNVLIAAPETADEVLRSGTWATVRYAIRLGIPVHLVPPGGYVEVR